MANDFKRADNPGVTHASDSERLVNQQADSIWNQLQGNWNQVKGRVREKWGLLTNDDLEHIAGHKDRLIGKIQEKYGKVQWSEADVEHELRYF
jgi:uncharacterized protein YjbJ (UPF0337 family)